MRSEPTHHIAAVAHHFLTEDSVAPARAAAGWFPVGPTLQTAVAASNCRRISKLVADGLALGTALVCCPLRIDEPVLPAGYEARLDTLIWCVTESETSSPLPARQLGALAARLRPRRVEILVLPPRWRPDSAPDPGPAPAVGTWRGRLTCEVPDLTAGIMAAGWHGESVAAAIQRLAQRLLRDRGCGRWGKQFRA